MTFNVRGSFWSEDGINIWENRAALNVATIRSHNPNLIGFQEVQSGNQEVYISELTDYEQELGPLNGNTEPYDYNPIYWQNSEFEYIKSGGYWLSRTPDEHSADWGTAWIRAATWVKLRHLASKLELLFINTHLDHISEEARVEGSKLILKKIHLQDQNIPIVLMGDFNCNPESSAYLLFKEYGFIDLYRVGSVEGDYQHTFHAFRGDQYNKSEHHGINRVDWILLFDPNKVLACKSCFIVYNNEEPLYPSNHYPVVVDLFINL